MNIGDRVQATGGNPNYKGKLVEVVPLIVQWDSGIREQVRKSDIKKIGAR